MDKNEIKKALYKEKPVAYLRAKCTDGYNYSCVIKSTNDTISFSVPHSDMGTSRHRFKDEMPAHELIRWMNWEIFNY